jgi:hypothetical protein
MLNIGVPVCYPRCKIDSQEPLFAMAELSPEEAKLNRYVDRITVTLDPKASAALGQIAYGKLIALRKYLREPKRVKNDWAWTEEQEKKFKQQPEYKTLMEAVGTVQEEFEKVKPGYTLVTNTKFRSLDTQLKYWNGNSGVKQLGASFEKKVLKEIARSEYPEEPDKDSLKTFIDYLKKEEVGGTTSHAVPGLSDHGHLEAFDFVVKKEGKVIAGTSTKVDPDTKVSYQKKYWDDPGYTEALKAAVKAANAKLKKGRFEGPLKAGSLYEPWHYTYKD